MKKFGRTVKATSPRTGTLHALCSLSLKYNTMEVNAVYLQGILRDEFSERWRSGALLRCVWWSPDINVTTRDNCVDVIQLR